MHFQELEFESFHTHSVVSSKVLYLNKGPEVAIFDESDSMCGALRLLSLLPHCGGAGNRTRVL